MQEKLQLHTYNCFNHSCCCCLQTQLQYHILLCISQPFNTKNSRLKIALNLYIDQAEEPNPYDDMLSAEDFNRLFGESDDEHFEGF